MPNFAGHHFYKMIERNSVSKEYLKVLSVFLHLTLNLQLLSITVSVPCLCNIFDSDGLLNSSLRNIYKVG